MQRGKKKLRLWQSGFTLVELLVVLVLMSLMTLAFLEQQNKFDSSTILRSLTYSVALSVRQAQVYGVSVVGTNGNFTAPQALEFCSISSPGSSCSTQYILFSDTLYDQTNPKPYMTGDIIKQTFNINSSYQITGFCGVYYNAGTPTGICYKSANFVLPSGSTVSGLLSKLDIVFRRPNPDALIYAFDASDAPLAPPASFAYAYIQIKSNNDSSVRGIRIYNTGQVAVDQTPDLRI